MTKGHTVGQLQKLLQRLPVRERQALIRRAKLRSVSGNEGQETQYIRDFREDILCKLSEAHNEHIESTSKSLRHGDCVAPPPVAKDNGAKGRKAPLRPINNFPTYGNYEGGAPEDAITLEIFSLRRRVTELTADLILRNEKITRALVELQSQRRYFRLLISDNQGESYDQIQTRIRKIESTIHYVEDPVAGHVEELPIPDRWKKRGQ